MTAQLKFLGVAVILFFCGLMLQIIAPYLTFPFPTDIDFLLTKQNVLPIPIWRWAFYVHITSSLLTLASGLTQFSRRVYRRYPLLHRRVSRTVRREKLQHVGPLVAEPVVAPKPTATIKP